MRVGEGFALSMRWREDVLYILMGNRFHGTDGLDAQQWTGTKAGWTKSQEDGNWKRTRCTMGPAFESGPVLGFVSQNYQAECNSAGLILWNLLRVGAYLSLEEQSLERQSCEHPWHSPRSSIDVPVPQNSKYSSPQSYSCMKQDQTLSTRKRCAAGMGS